jgi:hypothetical protein
MYQCSTGGPLAMRRWDGGANFSKRRAVMLDSFETHEHGMQKQQQITNIYQGAQACSKGIKTSSAPGYHLPCTSHQNPTTSHKHMLKFRNNAAAPDKREHPELFHRILSKSLALSVASMPSTTALLATPQSPTIDG